MNFLYLLGTDLFPTNGAEPAINDIANFLNDYLIPFTITLCVLGALMAIILAAAIVKEDDPKKAADFKKKIVGMVVTIFIVIGLVWILGWIMTSYQSIIDSIKPVLSF